jgi:putative MFS transporter
MIALAHRRAFWFGIAAVSAGVVLHLPMYIGAADMGYQLAGMAMNPSMKVGMALIVVGIALSAYGVVPRGAGAYPDRVAGVRVAALDEAPIQRAHLALLTVMAVAVTIDVMKPTTLAFVVPGMAQEYDLKSPLNPQGEVPVALLPLCALIGMVLGSAGWGWLGDRIGRRASILLASATSCCWRRGMRRSTPGPRSTTPAAVRAGRADRWPSTGRWVGPVFIPASSCALWNGRW